jgi:hypothetical protein
LRKPASELRLRICIAIGGQPPARDYYNVEFSIARMEDGSTRSFATLQSVYINPAWLTFSIVGEPLTYQADALRCLMLEAIARPVWASTLARNSYSLVAIAAPLTA